MPDTLVLLAIFAALAFLAIRFAQITIIMLIVLFFAALGSGVAFLLLGLREHF